MAEGNAYGHMVSVVEASLIIQYTVLVVTSGYKVMKTFVCRGCVNPVSGTGLAEVDIGAGANLELVDKFCYLSDILSVDRDADAAVETRI